RLRSSPRYIAMHVWHAGTKYFPSMISCRTKVIRRPTTAVPCANTVPLCYIASVSSRCARVPRRLTGPAISTIQSRSSYSPREPDNDRSRRTYFLHRGALYALAQAHSGCVPSDFCFRVGTLSAGFPLAQELGPQCSAAALASALEHLDESLLSR